MQDSSAVAVLTPADILTAEQMDPERRMLLVFLANRTAATRLAYEIDLQQFHRWTRDMGLRSMLAAERVHLELYLEHLKAKGLAEATITRRFGTVKLFLHAAYDEELISQDPTRRIKCPKIDREKQRRTWLSTIDMALVMRAAASDPRDNALMMFMSNTAMRVGEVCALDVANLHREPGRVWVGFIGKGNRSARIDLPYATLTALDTYLGDRAEGPLFVNDKHTRMTRRQVSDALQRLAKRAGVTAFDTSGRGQITPHGIRRTHAKTLAEAGADLLDIAESLRHRDTRVTRDAYIGQSTGRGTMARQKATDIFTNMAG